MYEYRCFDVRSFLSFLKDHPPTSPLFSRRTDTSRLFGESDIACTVASGLVTLTVGEDSETADPDVSPSARKATLAREWALTVSAIERETGRDVLVGTIDWVGSR